jgi:hypothetical protein
MINKINLNATKTKDSPEKEAVKQTNDESK